MKRFAFLVLVFAATAIAEEEGVQQWAENFESDVETVQMCLNNAETTEAEIQTLMKQAEKIRGSNIDDETKKVFEKHNSFMACMLEKKDMMKDSKLVVDKIIEITEKESDKYPINKDVVKECLNALNDDSGMTREDRAMGVVICILASEENKNKKK